MSHLAPVWVARQWEGTPRTASPGPDDLYFGGVEGVLVAAPP